MHQFPPQLYDNAVLTAVILFFAFLNILAWGRNGIFLREIAMLYDIHNERTFNIGEAQRSKIKPFMLAQYHLFFGLTFLFVAFPEPAALLAGLCTPSLDAYLTVLACIAVPLGWFLLHYFFIHWFCYIFGGDGRLFIIDRIYRATHLLCGPLALFLFTLVAVTDISQIIAAILLIAIFIMTQIAFISNGIKIFYNGFGSICLFFVYLCALEIAPLAVFFVKMF